MVWSYIDVSPFLDRDQWLKFNALWDWKGSDEGKEDSDETEDEDDTSDLISDNIPNCSKKKIEVSIHFFKWSIVSFWTTEGSEESHPGTCNLLLYKEIFRRFAPQNDSLTL